MQAHVCESLNDYSLRVWHCVQTLKNYVFEECLLVWGALTSALKAAVTRLIALYAVAALAITRCVAATVFTASWSTCTVAK